MIVFRSFIDRFQVEISLFPRETIEVLFSSLNFSGVPFRVVAMDSQQTSQFAQYIPVLILLLAAVGFAVGVLTLSVLLGKFAKRSKAKDSPYECGKDPISDGGARFSVKFHLVAMLFILFDIEVVFLGIRGRWFTRTCSPITRPAI